MSATCRIVHESVFHVMAFPCRRTATRRWWTACVGTWRPWRRNSGRRRSRSRPARRTRRTGASGPWWRPTSWCRARAGRLFLHGHHSSKRQRSAAQLPAPEKKSSRFLGGPPLESPFEHLLRTQRLAYPIRCALRVRRPDPWFFPINVLRSSNDVCSSSVWLRPSATSLVIDSPAKSMWIFLFTAAAAS